MAATVTLVPPVTYSLGGRGAEGAPHPQEALNVQMWWDQPAPQGPHYDAAASITSPLRETEHLFSPDLQEEMQIGHQPHTANVSVRKCSQAR